MSLNMENAASVKNFGSSDKEKPGSAPVGKLLFRLAVPTVTAQIINMLYNIVDRIYVGHIPGEGQAALTGLGVCLPLIMLVSAFSASAAVGRTDPQNRKNTNNFKKRRDIYRCRFFRAITLFSFKKMHIKFTF